MTMLILLFAELRSMHFFLSHKLYIVNEFSLLVLFADVYMQ